MTLIFFLAVVMTQNMASVFSQFSIKMNFECYSAYLQAGQVNNKGAVTSLYSSS